VERTYRKTIRSYRICHTGNYGDNACFSKVILCAALVSVVNKNLSFKAKAMDLTSEHVQVKDRFRLLDAREHKTKKK